MGAGKRSYTPTGDILPVSMPNPPLINDSSAPAGVALPLNAEACCYYVEMLND